MLEAKLVAMGRIALMRDSLKKKTQALSKANEELARLAKEDGLTKVGNRRYIDTKLQELIEFHGRHQLPLALILLDVDYFKPYNDRYGHIAGDKCLKAVADLLRTLFERSGEYVGRYGGEEFVVLLSHTDSAKVSNDARRIQNALKKLNITHEYSAVSSHVTVSQGVVSKYLTGKESVDELYQLADKQLYNAKLSGRAQFKLDKENAEQC